MVKVVYLPLNSADVKQTGMYDAFKNAGVDLTIFDFNINYNKTKNKEQISKDFIKIISEKRPDLLHMQLQFTDIISLEDLKKVKNICPNVIITNWTGDVWHNVPPVFSNISKGVDISLISSVGQLPMYKKSCTGEVRYWQIGYNPKLYFAQNRTSFKFNLTFVATKYKNETYPSAGLRTQCGLNLSKSISNFNLVGHGWGHGVSAIKQSLVNDVYNNSFAVLSISNFNDLGFYFSDRLLMCLASGRPTICYRFPGWDDYFSDMKNIIIVNSQEEIIEKFNWLKSNPIIANKIGKSGAEIALREHSYFCRTIELLKMVGLQ